MIKTGITILHMTILLIIVVVVICQQMRITVKLSFIHTYTRLRYHYFRYVNKGGGVYLDKKNRPNLMMHQSKNIHLLYIYTSSTIVILFLEQSMSYNYENSFV